jgi:hypothetical protein
VKKRFLGIFFVALFGLSLWCLIAKSAPAKTPVALIPERLKNTWIYQNIPPFSATFSFPDIKGLAMTLVCGGMCALGLHLLTKKTKIDEWREP